MMNIKSKNEEFTLFNRLSDEWWNENGKFKILHQIKSHRMTYILDQIGNRDIKNLKILDVGCGGGIICEPLARLGAKVTGIDLIFLFFKIAERSPTETASPDVKIKSFSIISFDSI